MKRSSIPLTTIACTGLFASSLAAEIRTFTSADGSKTLLAECVATAGEGDNITATLVLDDGRAMKVRADVFSLEDQGYLADVNAAQKAARALSIRLEETRGESEREEIRWRRITTTPTKFSIEVRNNGRDDVTDLEVDYQVFYRDAVRVGSKDGERMERRIAGKLALAELPPRGDKMLTTEPVAMVSDRPNKGGPG